MLNAAIIKDGEKIELVWGQLVETAPQRPLHWDMTSALSHWFRVNLPLNLRIASQGPLRLSEDDEPEPEFFIFPEGMRVNEVRGGDVLLVVEVAYSSLDYDLKVKSVVYAQHGVREYWVVDVEGKRTLVHTLGADGGYGAPREVAFDAALDAPGGARLAIADLAPKV